VTAGFVSVIPIASFIAAPLSGFLLQLAARRLGRSQGPTCLGPKPALTGAALRKAIMAIWCVCFCGMQWRVIGQLCDIPFGALYNAVRPVDPARAVAPAAQPLDPGLAAGSRRRLRT
jgi:hypothetical protein